MFVSDTHHEDSKTTVNTLVSGHPRELDEESVTENYRSASENYSYKRTPKKRRVDVRFWNCYIGLLLIADERTACFPPNENLIKPIPTVLLLCQRSYFCWFANSRKIVYYAWGVRQRESVKKEKNQNFTLKKPETPTANSCFWSSTLLTYDGPK